jgi:hypothetical protein
MPRHKEELSGGLRTAFEPGMLEPGELSHLQNYVYRGGSNTLWYANGRQAFGTASATASEVDGLRDVHFDNGDHYLVALVSGQDARYRYVSVSGAATSGTFADLTTLPATGQSLEVAHFRNRFYLFDGASASASAIGSNTVVYLSATAASQTPLVRQHGMLPVVDAPTATTAAGAFSQTDGTFPAYYEYWTTEVAKLTQDGAVFVMESTYATDPVTVLIQSTGVVPTIQMPATRNSITTHWRVYRSPRKDFQSDKKFPAGFMISEQLVPGVATTAASATASIYVTDTLTSSATGFIGPTSFNSGVAYSTWTNASNMATADASSATIAGQGVFTRSGQGVYGFAFGNFLGTVRGIEVQFKAAVSAGNPPAVISVTIGKRYSNGSFVPDGVKDSFGSSHEQTYLQYNTGSLGITVTGTSAGVYTVGGPTSLWKASNVPPFTDSDFDANFMVVLSTVLPTGRTLSVDYVAVKVYFGATQNSTIQFPQVVYTFGDVVAQVGKNGPPPSSNTGDVYEDTLVVNDVQSPSFIRYSFPGDPEAFPQTYFIDFETRENDKVTLIKVVNNRLVVGLDTSIWRVNYLPSERDASFDRGKAIEVISRSVGVINPMCACTFTMEGGQENLAWVSQKGLHTTDGYGFQTRSARLAWRGAAWWTEGVLPFGVSSAIALLNNPEEQELLFFYRNDLHSSDSYLCMHFSYAQGNVLEDGDLKASGPVIIRNYDNGSVSFANLKSAWAVPRANGDTSIFMGYGGTNTTPGAGQVFIEASGTSLPALNSTASYSTRRMFLAGEGQEFRVNEVLEYAHSTTIARNISWSTQTVKTNQGSENVSQSSKSVTIATGAAAGNTGTHWRIPMSFSCEGVIFTRASSPKGPEGIEYLIVDGDDFAEEDSGK